MQKDPVNIHSLITLPSHSRFTSNQWYSSQFNLLHTHRQQSTLHQLNHMPANQQPFSPWEKPIPQITHSLITLTSYNPFTSQSMVYKSVQPGCIRRQQSTLHQLNHMPANQQPLSPWEKTHPSNHIFTHNFVITQSIHF